jgi:branched-chain amino acid transport system substrate-binding protein
VLTACSTPTTTPTPGGTTTPTPGQTSTPTVPAGTKTVKIGLLGSFTGSYAPYGGPMRDSGRNALKMVNAAGGFDVNGQNYKVEFVEYDDRTDTKRAVAGITMMKDLYDIDLVLGPMTSPCALAAQPIGEARHIIRTSFASATEITRPGIVWTWTNTVPHSYRARYDNKYYVNEMGVKTVAILTENNATYISIREGAIEYWPKYGAKILADDLVEAGTTDFSTVIAKLRRLNPDVLHINTIPASSILLVKQVYEAGWRVQIVSYVDVVSDDLFRAAGAAAEGVMGEYNIGYWAIKNNLVTQATLDAMKLDKEWYMQVCDSYIADYTDKNMNFATFYYTLLNSFIKAMQKAGSVDDEDKINAAMAGLEFQDPSRWVKVLPNHRYNQYPSVTVFHQSTVGADKFEILAVASSNDDYMDTWDLTIIQDYPKIDEIRKTRGY